MITKQFFKVIIWVCCIIGNFSGVVAQNFEWVKSIGGGSADNSSDIAVDTDGNVFIIGFFSGTTNFNPGSVSDTVTSKGSSDIFMVKYDSSGNYLWAISIGGTGIDRGRGIAVDSLGNVYITGQFADLVDFDPGPNVTTLASAGATDVFLAKYDPNGNYIWAIKMGGAVSHDIGIDVEIDPFGNVCLTGCFVGSVDFDPGANSATLVSSSPSNYDIFLAKYDASGNYLWAKSFAASPTGSETPDCLTTDDKGNIYMVGGYAAFIDMDPGAGTAMLNGKGNVDAFIAKYDSAGNYVWAKSIGSLGDDGAMGVCLDDVGNVYITGYSNDTLYFSGISAPQLIPMGQNSPYIAKYDTAGNYIWSRNFGNPTLTGTGQSPQGIVVVGNQRIFLTGYFAGKTSFNSANPGDTLNSINGSIDVYLIEYDSSGTFKQAQSIGGSSPERGGPVVFHDGNLFLTGHFQGVADFDPGMNIVNLTSAGGFDAFALKLRVCDNSESSQLTVSIECGDEYYLNEEVYDSTGIYTQRIPNEEGCYSTVTIDLTVLPISQPDITIDSFTLGINGRYATYQWFKNGQPIPGATDSTYTVTENATYTVKVSNQHGCEATSNDYPVNNVPGASIGDIGSLAAQIVVYPNPANEIVYINSPEAVDIAVTAIDGRILYYKKNATAIVLKEWATGIYFLHILDKEGRLLKVEKIVRK